MAAGKQKATAVPHVLVPPPTAATPETQSKKSKKKKRAAAKARRDEVDALAPSDTLDFGMLPAPDKLFNDMLTHSAQHQVPVATLFPTGLIPLERAANKFKHAHCLERLPPQPDLADSSTSSSGNRRRHTRGWSFSRFKKQKA